jgi:surfeit locus 1 family protein
MAGLTGPRVVVALAALVTVAVTARLGVWQLDRASQKRGLQEAIDQRRALPPLAQDELARDGAAVDDQVHRLTALTGHWVAEATVYLDNRQMGGRPGFYVVTPLRLADGTAVAVQRGWWPRNVADRARVQAPAPPRGEVLVTGRIAPPPARLYEFDGAAEGPIRQNLDLSAWARETGLTLRPLSLLQTAEEQPVAGPAVTTDAAAAPAQRPGERPAQPGAEGAPARPAAGAPPALGREWPAPAAGVHKHLGYAFQWFALSTLTIALYVWFQILRPRRAAHGHPVA